MAEDTGGEAAAGPFYDAAKATFTTLIDATHLVPTLFGMVNVPTAVLIDEKGTIVRHDEDAYSQKYGNGNFTFGNDLYRPAVVDWIEKGADSEYAMTPAEVMAPLSGTTDAQATADAAFKLGVYFHQRGDAEKAQQYWDRSQELYPDSWNFHRQDWSFLEPTETNQNWFRKFQALDGKPYYRPLDLPQPDAP